MISVGIPVTPIDDWRSGRCTNIARDGIARFGQDDRVRVALVVVVVGCSYELTPNPDTVGFDAATGDASATSDGQPTDGATADGPSDQITCPGSTCGSVCCEGTCVDALASLCTGKTYECDGPEDCNTATGEVCCNSQNGSVCTTAGSCTGGNSLEVCHVGQDCSGGCTSCTFESGWGQRVCCE
jgi:hypothetical protein